MITERDLGIVCDSGSCTCQAVYAVTVRNLADKQIIYTRMYCPEHTKELTKGVADIIAKPEHDGKMLHDYLEVEHIESSVNA